MKNVLMTLLVVFVCVGIFGCSKAVSVDGFVFIRSTNPYIAKRTVRLIFETCTYEGMLGTVNFYIDHGKLNRDDGPALICKNKNSYWFKRNRLHRITGPAVVLNNGNKEWWVKGKEYTEEEFNQKFRGLQ